MLISDISLESGEDSVDNDFGLIESDEELADLS